MRGEKRTDLAPGYIEIGSPPHAWGKVPGIPCTCDVSRFTPTCVGKRMLALVAESQRPVHPHMRGEK